MERLMTVKGMQARYGCSLPTAREFLHKRGCPSFKVGREIRIEKNALFAFIQSSKGCDYDE